MTRRLPQSILINKKTGILEYHDFGRYITPEPNGRVRGKDTDHELEFPIVAKIENDTIVKKLEIYTIRQVDFY